MKVIRENLFEDGSVQKLPSPWSRNFRFITLPTVQNFSFYLTSPWPQNLNVRFYKATNNIFHIMFSGEQRSFCRCFTRLELLLLDNNFKQTLPAFPFFWNILEICYYWSIDILWALLRVCLGLAKLWVENCAKNSEKHSQHQWFPAKFLNHIINVPSYCQDMPQRSVRITRHFRVDFN